MAIKRHPSLAVHPGEWLSAEMFEPTGMTVGDFAARLGVTRQTMSKLFNRHQGLAGEMAIRFEKASGLRAETTVRMQAAHELGVARAREDEIEVERVAA